MSDVLAAFFRQYTKTAPSDDEYVGEDGLFYCKKCNTPTQCRIRVGGMERIVFCMCQCRKEDQEAYEKKLEEISQRNRIMSLKATGIHKTRKKPKTANISALMSVIRKQWTKILCCQNASMNTAPGGIRRTM